MSFDACALISEALAHHLPSFVPLMKWSFIFLTLVFSQIIETLELYPNKWLRLMMKRDPI